MPDKTNMLYERDCRPDALHGKTIAVIGFGSQGHAHALNLRDSGFNVIVANRTDSENGKRAVEQGFQLLCGPDAVAQADLSIIALPDEVQPDLFDSLLAPSLKQGSAVGFIHGFNIHFQMIKPPDGVDVILVAPMGAGKLVRSEFIAKRGVPGLLAIHRDVTGSARNIALAWTGGIGCARAGVIETTFKDECETDLFGEQVVLCGGVSALMKSAYETLTRAGYPEELAYMECIHQLKFLVDLIHEGGIDFMRSQISNTAKYGDLTRGPRIIDAHVQASMKTLLEEIRNGDFAKQWRAEYAAGLPEFSRLLKREASHPLEAVGRKLRSMMSWTKADKCA